MLSRSDLRRHERRLKPLFIGSIILDLAAFASLGFETGPTSLLFIAALIQGIRLQMYVLKDISTRGASPLWACAPGFNLVVWLVWRRSRPIVA